MLSYVVLLAVVISGTNSIAPCDEKLIAGLTTNKECYKDGKPPVMMSSKEAEGAVGTTLRITKDDLLMDMKCLTGNQDKKNTYVNVFWNNGSTTTIPFEHEVKDGYVIETDEKGHKFRMYIVHNENFAFSYYKCIDGTSGGTNTHMVNIAADCKKVKNADTLAVVEKAVTCFKKLGLNDIVELMPCDC